MSKQKLLFTGFALLLAIFAVAHSSPGEVFTIPRTLAQTMDNVPESWSNTMNSVAVKASHALLFINIAGFLALEFVEFFLRPDLLAGGSLAGDDGALKNLWIMSRDIMNILFAMMLIGVAFYTIMSGKSEKIKEHIVHFILAVILVNFSWFFPRIIIDIAHVTTSTIFSIPNVITNQLNLECKTFDNSACVILTRATVFPERQVVNTCQPIMDDLTLEEVAQGAGPDGLRIDGMNNCQCLRGRDDDSAPICWWVTLYEDGQADSYTLINALAVNYGRLTSLSQVAKFDPPDGPGQQPQATLEMNFFLNLFFSLFFGIAMVFPFVALAIGLLMRILILWATMAFMPFAFIGFAVKGKLGTDVFGMSEDFIWKEFLAAAFLPVLVAIPISVGFVMVLAGVQVPPVRPPDIDFGTSGLISGIDDWWEFLWAIVAVAIMWTGAFAALKKSKYIGSVTDRIQAFGKSAGSAVAKLPLLTPLPTPGGGSVRLGKILAAPKMLNTAIDQTILGKGSLIENLNRSTSGAPQTDEIERARSHFKKPEGQDDKDEIKKYMRVLTDQAATMGARNDALEKIRFILSEEKKGGMRKDSLDDETELIAVLKNMEADLDLTGTDFKQAEKLATAGSVNITASTASPTTHVNIEGSDVDLRQLNDVSKVGDVFKSLKIDPAKINTRAGYEQAISALQSASKRVETPALKTKTAAMAAKLTEMMKNNKNTSSAEEAFKQVAATST